MHNLSSFEPGFEPLTYKTTRLTTLPPSNPIFSDLNLHGFCKIYSAYLPLRIKKVWINFEEEKVG
jgi:hypothetical protein